MLYFSLCLMVAAIAMEVLFALNGYFRVWPIETLPCVVLSLVTAAWAWRQRRSKGRTVWLGLATVLAVFYGWASFIATRLPEPTEVPTSIELVATDLEGSRVRLPADMQRAHALIVLFRGAW
jgi:CHASE2 domain-containing sensor protein